MATNPRIEEHLKNNSLIKFSPYTDTQCKIVKWLGQEIIKCLDAANGTDPPQIQVNDAMEWA